MVSSGQTIIPRYLKIAVNIASRIASGEIVEGEKLKGRSVLSTEYNVSPETIRRSMSILSNKKVVEISPGMGIAVISRGKAVEFLKSFKEDESICDMNIYLSELHEKRKSIDEEILNTEKKLIEMYRYMRTDLITPIEIDVPENSYIIGRSIGDLDVWHNTGATILGIIQERNIIISPGPYYEFSKNDSVLIVGDENVIERFNMFINRAQDN